MTTNFLKLGIAGVVALACIIALILDGDTAQDWAVPVLTLTVGYVVGNAQVTENAPIIKKG